MSYLSPPQPPWKEGYFNNYYESDNGPKRLNEYQLSKLKMQLMGEYSERLSEINNNVNLIRKGQKMIWSVILGISALAILFFFLQ